MGYRAKKTLRLPIKPLAVHSGLAEYGRNNITYVEGMGSFHHLFAFYSDLPCEQDEWHEMKMLKRCENCRACIIKCPTGAIGEDRFLLHAERCLSFFNEKPANVPFPAWIDPSWHNSIYGCMICQRYCPEDKKFKDWVETRAEFSQEETALLLSDSSGALPAAIMEKLDQLELVESLDVLPRNLGVLLNREQVNG
jgi:epoxyqueuosine reductase